MLDGAEEIRECGDVMWFGKKKSEPKKRPVLFLHIQKTAGTSLLEVARRHYGMDMTSHGDCWNEAPEAFRNVGFLSGHFGYDFARHLMKDRFTFTFLRNPAERVLSMYYFCRDRDPEEFEIYKRASQLELPEFLAAASHDPWVRKNIWNNQVWQLAHGYAHLDDRTIDAFSGSDLLSLAKEHLDTFDHVGFVETIDQDGPRIFSAMGIAVPASVPKVNDTKNRPLQEDASPEIKDMLEEITSLDRQLYEYAWDTRMQKRSRCEQ